MQCVPLYSAHERIVTMSEKDTNCLELEYEHLYNLRDQTMLFLKMCPKTDGYANEILATLDEMVETIGRRLSEDNM